MMHELAKADAEGTNGSRHEQISTTRCLCATFQNTPVHRSHLVSMVGEIGSRTGIVETKLRADEQAALMVAGGKRTTEGCAGLAVAHIAVGKKYACRGREAIAQLTSLTNKAVLHLHRVDNAGSVVDDGVLTDDACTNIYVGLWRGDNRTVAQPGGTVNLTVVTDNGIGDLLGVDDLHTIA